MSRNEFSLSQQEKDEIIRFDILYRLNATQNGKISVILNRCEEYLEKSYTKLHSEGLLEINSDNHYYISTQGKELLHQYGVMFQRFRDLAIFKCVFLDGAPPENEGDEDCRFGAYDEHANPPDSEDLRLALFDYFFTKENRKSTLGIIVFFSLIENRRVESDQEDWVWGLENGEIFADIEDIVNSQPYAADICPEGWSEDEIMEEIYMAGTTEMKRCFEADKAKCSQEESENDDKDFWIEEVVEERIIDDEDDYYDPYWNNSIGVGSAFCIGAFAGLTTCAILS
ncbi:MAG: hypothetical protein HQL32_07640 [Planctomycetes bacterium]|nr:hypothetical protein [Planctomycetota bacterium]